MRIKRKREWLIPEGKEPTELERRVIAAEESGAIVPPRNLIKTKEQIEGIRRSGVVNTGVLDAVAAEIKAGMSTAEIDRIVYDYTVSHGAAELRRIPQKRMHKHKRSCVPRHTERK